MALLFAVSVSDAVLWSCSLCWLCCTKLRLLLCTMSICSAAATLDPPLTYC